MTESCTNCSKYADSAKKTPNSANPEVNGENGDLRIWDVIAYVYRIGSISLDEFKTHLKKVNDQEDYETKDLKEESLGMCGLCLSLLSDTYKTLKKFERLTHQATLVQKIQNVCTKNWQNRTEEEDPLTILVTDSSSLSSPSKIENEDLFDSFNFEENSLLDEVDNCFTDESKYETTTANDLYENKAGPIQESILKANVNHIQEKSAKKISLKSSKQLVIKIEKISDEDLAYFLENKRSKTNRSSRMQPRKGRKRNSSAIPESNKLEHGEADINLMCSKSQTNATDETIIPRKKLKFPSGVQRKYSSGNSKKEQSSTAENKNKFFNGNRYRKMHEASNLAKISCKLCDKVFAQEASFLWHMKSKHNQSTEECSTECLLTCEICGRTVHLNSFERHMDLHGPRKIFKCDKCGKEYLVKASYEAHILTHSDNFTPQVCRHCGKTLIDRSKTKLSLHERRCRGERNFLCEMCPKSFFTKAELDNHKAVHSEEKRFVCDECGMSYKIDYELKRHKKIHKDIAENGEYSARCQHCGRLFKHRKRLLHHMKIHDKKFECSFCGKILSKSSSLKDHENLHKANPDYQPRKNKTFKSDVACQPQPSSEIVKDN